MAKKQTTKRKFDWMTYSRPARLLTPAQEDSFAEGDLRTLLDIARERTGMSLEIRSRSAQFYYRGASLMRLTGDGPNVAEFDFSHRLPRPERTGELLERHQVAARSDVDEVVSLLTGLADTIDEEWDAEHDLTDRAARQRFAEANSAGDLYADDYVVVDMDFTYGQRRYDLLALQRTEGVTGPGGFANCELVFVDVRRSEKGLSGATGLASVGADLTDLAKAVGGSHMKRIREEVEELTRQKVRLGMLPAELELRALEERLPQLLVVFGGEVTSSAVDQAVIELHEKLVAKHFPSEHLRFAHLPDLMQSEIAELALHEGDAMTYREFKTYRKSLA